MTPHRYHSVQESEVVKAAHRAQLQMLVTEARLLVVAIILRLERRPAPNLDGPSTPRFGGDYEVTGSVASFRTCFRKYSLT